MSIHSNNWQAGMQARISCNTQQATIVTAQSANKNLITVHLKTLNDFIWRQTAFNILGPYKLRKMAT